MDELRFDLKALDKAAKMKKDTKLRDLIREKVKEALRNEDPVELLTQAVLEAVQRRYKLEKENPDCRPNWAQILSVEVNLPQRPKAGASCYNQAVQV